MKQDFLLIDGYTNDFVREVFNKTERHQPDDSVEFSECIEMTAFELAEQLVTGQVKSDKEVIRIPIDETVQDYLKEIYETFEKNDGRLFISYEFSEMLEEFLCSLGEYLVRADFNKPFCY
jgi:hypothetical protein